MCVYIHALFNLCLIPEPRGSVPLITSIASVKPRKRFTPQYRYPFFLPFLPGSLQGRDQLPVVILGIPPCPLPGCSWARVRVRVRVRVRQSSSRFSCISVRSNLALGIAAPAGVTSRALVSLTTRVHSHSSSFFFVEIYLATPLRRAATAPIRRTLF